MTSLPGPPRRGGIIQVRIRPPRRLRRDYFFRRADDARALSRTASLAVHDFRGPAAKGLSRLRAKRLAWFRVFSPPVLKLYFKLWRRGLRQEAMAAKISINRAAIFYSIAREAFFTPIAVGARRMGRRRKSCCRKSIASNRRSPVNPIIDRRDGLAGTIQKCSRAVAVISFSSGRLSTALSRPAGPSRRDRRDTRIRP